MRITEITRRKIFDVLVLRGFKWFGRLDDADFLSRLFDLNRLPSTDLRFPNAAGDICQHRVLNPQDWDDNWVFSDERFQLLSGDDEILLRFLCETIHPIVRPDTTECERIRQLYNDCLQYDGFQIVEKTRISNKPVYIGRYLAMQSPGVNAARKALATADAGYVAQQITRMESSVEDDPALAIGTAKELVETCCHTILDAANVAPSNSTNLARLVKLTTKELKLTPDDIPDAAKAADSIKRLLNNLATITQGIAELRNLYGTGHGKSAGTKGLQPRHAKLAVGAASTLAVFLTETHRDRTPSPAT